MSATEGEPAPRRICFWCGTYLDDDGFPVQCSGCGRMLATRVTGETTVAELAQIARDQGVRIVFSIRPLEADGS